MLKKYDTVFCHNDISYTLRLTSIIENGFVFVIRPIAGGAGWRGEYHAECGAVHQAGNRQLWGEFIPQIAEVLNTIHFELEINEAYTRGGFEIYQVVSITDYSVNYFIIRKYLGHGMYKVVDALDAADIELSNADRLAAARIVHKWDLKGLDMFFHEFFVRYSDAVMGGVNSFLDELEKE